MVIAKFAYIRSILTATPFRAAGHEKLLNASKFHFAFRQSHYRPPPQYPKPLFTCAMAERNFLAVARVTGLSDSTIYRLIRLFFAGEDKLGEKNWYRMCITGMKRDTCKLVAGIRRYRLSASICISILNS